MNDFRSQRTLASEATISGTALFSGRRASVRLEPADEDCRIAFVRKDVASRPRIHVSPSAVCGTDVGYSCISLGDEAPLFFPVEHLLAALAGLGITNATVLADGPELPFFDGSSRQFLEAIRAAGIREQDAARRAIEITGETRISDGGGELTVSPSAGLRIIYELDHPHPRIGRQSHSFDFTPERFASDIAPARTFCTEEEGRAFLERGGRGGSTAASLVIGRGGPIEGAFLFPDEPARHKILDIVGDLSLVGADIAARIEARSSGHRQNVALAKKLWAMMPGSSASGGMR